MSAVVFESRWEELATKRSRARSSTLCRVMPARIILESSGAVISSWSPEDVRRIMKKLEAPASVTFESSPKSQRIWS